MLAAFTASESLFLAVPAPGRGGRRRAGDFRQSGHASRRAQAERQADRGGERRRRGGRARRYLDINEDDQLDEAQFADWVKQASQLPGERM